MVCSMSADGHGDLQTTWYHNGRRDSVASNVPWIAYSPRSLYGSPCYNMRSRTLLQHLRRLLTYLRSTQRQDRMSNLALIHCHRDVARTVSQLPVLMKEFVSKNQVRRNMFLDAESEENKNN